MIEQQPSTRGVHVPRDPQSFNSSDVRAIKIAIGGGIVLAAAAAVAIFVSLLTLPGA